jgi:hypothetical protein
MSVLSARTSSPAPSLAAGAAAEDLGAITSPILKSLLDVWRAKSGERPMPRRAEISMRDIKGILPAIFMADVADGGESFVATLIGSALTNVTGHNATGQKITSVARNELDRRFWTYLRRCTATAAPLAVITDRAIVESVRFARGENLILPLSDDGVTVNKIIGACDLLLPPAMGGGSADAIISHVTLN